MSLTDDIRRSGNIKFIGVGRAADRVLVASLTAIKSDSAEQYHTAVREVLSAPDFSKKVSPGARYRLVGDINAFNFTTDPEQRVYIVISSFDYPERLVFPMINDLVLKFKPDFGQASLTCPAGALDSKTKRLFQSLAEEYDDPTKSDKLLAVQHQIQGVKKTMGQNLDNMLKNIDKATDIEDAAKKMQDQAAKFDQSATALKRRELCRKWQFTAGIVLVVLIILIIVIVFFVGTPTIPAPAPSTPAPGPAPSNPTPAPLNV